MYILLIFKMSDRVLRASNVNIARSNRRVRRPSNQLVGCVVILAPNGAFLEWKGQIYVVDKMVFAGCCPRLTSRCDGIRFAELLQSVAIQ